jgi:hypothetical protein
MNEQSSERLRDCLANRSDHLKRGLRELISHSELEKDDKPDLKRNR